MRTIRASEIGTFLFCARAWWYQKQNLPSQNQAELAGGTVIHEQHGQAVIVTGCLRVLAAAILLFALGLLVFALTLKLL